MRRLSWAPPSLVDPVIWTPTESKPKSPNFGPDQDVVVQMPSRPLDVAGGIEILSGRNVRVIGGHLGMNTNYYGSTGDAGRTNLALKIVGNPDYSEAAKNRPRTIHIEGLKFDGTELFEGINVDSKGENALTLCLQAVYFGRIRWKSPPGGGSGHHGGDALQIVNGPIRLLVDSMTMSALTYQGFWLQPTAYGTTTPELYDFRNVQFIGVDTRAQLLAQNGSLPPVENRKLTNVWVQPASGQSWSQSVKGEWPGLQQGTAPEPMVRSSEAGIGYVSPGYTDGSEPLPPIEEEPTPLPEDLLGRYTFGSSSAVAVDTDSGAVFSPATKGDGSALPITSEFGFSTDPVARVLPTANARPQDHQEPADSVEFTVTPPAGQSLDITGFAFHVARGGDSQPRSIEWRSSLDGYARPFLSVPNVETVRPLLTRYAAELTDHKGLTGPVTFRGFYATPGTNLSLEIDDISVTGAVVEVLPEIGVTPLPVEVLSPSVNQQFRFYTTPADVVFERTIRYRRAGSEDAWTVDPYTGLRANDHLATVHDADTTSKNPPGTSYEGYIRLAADGFHSREIPIAWVSPPESTSGPNDGFSGFYEVVGGAEQPLDLVGYGENGQWVPVVLEGQQVNPLDIYSDTY